MRVAIINPSIPPFTRDLSTCICRSLLLLTSTVLPIDSNPKKRTRDGEGAQSRRHFPAHHCGCVMVREDAIV